MPSFRLLFHRHEHAGKDAIIKAQWRYARTSSARSCHIYHDKMKSFPAPAEAPHAFVPTFLPARKLAGHGREFHLRHDTTCIISFAAQKATKPMTGRISHGPTMFRDAASAADIAMHAAQLAPRRRSSRHGYLNTIIGSNRPRP